MEDWEINNITRKEALRQMGGLALGSTFIPSLMAGREDKKAEAQGRKKNIKGSQPDSPHIIFLMCDQFRADALGCAGNSAVKTPNIDAIARNGALFTNAYSAVPSCTPARACLLTGMSPWSNGMLGYGRMARKYKYEMPRMIREAGYYAYGVGKNHFFPLKSLHGFNGTLVEEGRRSPQDGFVSDYHDWFKLHAPRKNPNATGLPQNGYQPKAYAFNEDLHVTHWTGNTTIEFLNNYNLENPLFLKVSFIKPHSPYNPPQRFVDMYKGVKIPPPAIGGKGSWDEKFAHDHPNNLDAWLGNFGKAQALKSRKYYYANITFVDEQIGRIIDLLKQKGMYANSIITFCADHGDMLGDHYHWRKTYPYEGSAAIPFIYKWPAGFKASVKRGSKLSEPVGLQDFLPTFLEATGRQIPEDMDGMSLLKLLRGNTEGWRTYMGMEHSRAYWKENYWTAATDGKFKYIWYFSSYPAQFFDLENDPDETNNILNQPHISGSMQKEIQKWRRYLVDYLKGRGPGFVKNGHIVKRQKSMLYSPNYSHYFKNESERVKYWKSQYKKSYKP